MKNAAAKNETQKDRRSSRRYDSIHKVGYKVLIPMEGEGFTQNISDGGFALFLDKEVPPGAVLELKFQNPSAGTQPDRSIVKVMWQRDHLAAVKVLGR